MVCCGLAISARQSRCAADRRDEGQGAKHIEVSDRGFVKQSDRIVSVGIGNGTE